MLKFVRSAAAAALSLVLVLGLSACADIDGNGDAKVLKMALEIAPNALTTQMAQQAADQIKEETIAARGCGDLPLRSAGLPA
mgnify:CR=1 FL=1